VLRLHPSQEEQLYALVADCAIGRPGSAILMTRSSADPSQPALIYLKAYPLTSSNGDAVTHFLCVLADLPLMLAERVALLNHCGSFADMPSADALAASREQGDITFREHRQQHRMRQERVQQAHFFLAATGAAHGGADPSSSALVLATSLSSSFSAPSSSLPSTCAGLFMPSRAAGATSSLGKGKKRGGKAGKVSGTSSSAADADVVDGVGMECEG
jgi:hypothetical protein